MCTIFLNIGEDFNTNDYKCKRTGTNENCFITHLSTFGSKIFSTQKIMDFENVALTKIVHIYVIEGMNA